MFITIDAEYLRTLLYLAEEAHEVHADSIELTEENMKLMTAEAVALGVAEALLYPPKEVK